MPKLIIENLNRTEVELPSGSQSVLNAIQQHAMDWMQACGGKGRCTTCLLIVVSGMPFLTLPTPHELRYRNENRLKTNERLACQCHMMAGEVVVRVPDRYKLPHVRYS
jgi:2Fe-2S ferredoxin